MISLCALAVLAACAPALADPAVRFAGFAPIVIRGAGFAAREEIEVVVSLGSTEHTQAVRTSAQGDFEVTFSHATVRDRCGTSIWAHATTRRGDRVSAKLPQPQCPLAL
jgi:hypothetical protein